MPIEAQIKEPLEIAVHHCDLRAGELLKVCGGTGVIDMGVRDEQQPDVIGLEAEFADRSLIPACAAKVFLRL